jgi:hypothetical protein
MLAGEMISEICRYVIPGALSLMHPQMDSPEARALLLAIGLQESRFLHRSQRGNGPARGFWQFEIGGVVGVVQHHATAEQVQYLLHALRYPASFGALEIHEALAHNDLLAAGIARALLWTLPGALPGPDGAAEGWRLYTAAWRPGKPHRDTWDGIYKDAWSRTVNSLNTADARRA